MRAIVLAEGLGKTFVAPERTEGLRAGLASLFRRKYVSVEAVKDVSFSLVPGEIVGFLGPNGAGKTTTLKMLAGLLFPTTGRVEVAGFRPDERKNEFLRAISLVMGQKRQLAWDLPAVDSFDFNRVVYGVPLVRYRAVREELVAALDLGAVLHKPVRQLSLGERMKCELVAALLHEPRLLFLDEPTIGMDVSSQLALRDFVRRYAERHEATVLLTSHDMNDVAALCPRIIVIDGGALRFDGRLVDLRRQIRPLRRVSIATDGELPDAFLADCDASVRREGPRLVVDAPDARVTEVVRRLSELSQATELTVTDAPLEEVMRDLFARKGVAPVAPGALETVGERGAPP